MFQRRQRAAQQFALAPAQGALPGGIDREPGAGMVGHQQQILRDVPDAVALARAPRYLVGQSLVIAAQFGFGLLGLGDVVGDADEPDMLAIDAPARLRLRADPAPLAVAAPVAR